MHPTLIALIILKVIGITTITIIVVVFLPILIKEEIIERFK